MLSPPTASEPVKPQQQASNEVIKTVTAGAPKADVNAITFQTSSSSSTSASDNSSPATDGDTLNLTLGDTSDKSATKNDQAKKMYCN